jgi:hypothetical protein
MSKGRVDRGAQAQENFATILKHFNVPVHSVAPKHSNVPDIIFSLDNEQVQAEVKNTEDFMSITIFDKSVSRKSVRSRADNSDVNKLIKKFKGFKTFEEYVDHLRKVKGDEYVGFRGDEGIKGVSGKLPKEEFAFTSSTEKSAFIDVIRDHWAKNNDDFFTIISTNGKEFAIFSTDTRSKKIVGINASSFSARHIKEVYLATAGKASGDGRLRVALKVKLNTSSIKKVYTTKLLR